MPLNENYGFGDLDATSVGLFFDLCNGSKDQENGNSTLKALLNHCTFSFACLSVDLLMSVVAEKAEPLTASSSSLEVDPLLKDLTEKKLIFKKNVATLAAELKDVRHRLVLQEQSFAKEAHARKVAEMRAGSMEEEIGRLSCLERWLKQCGKNVGKCPQCSKKFRRKEIVNLYAPVIVVPNADLEKEVQCLKKENMSLKIEVGWDESTSGERQPRVSLWEIEPLTTFPMYPSSFPLRLKRPWPSDLPSLQGGRDDLMWLRDGDRAIQSWNFQGFCNKTFTECYFKS
ncbi:hypothetical protein ZIOFF_018282 [Zingiber officinale]|uniref:Uncharacterized protein n=1 Tax=Zingiber officinale TaxID=94328 RepID=A0A8J5HCR5_ZINOF|nr:hypothetical protein ZIOFF_018282 [Zingiber officinale]